MSISSIRESTQQTIQETSLALPKFKNLAWNINHYREFGSADSLEKTSQEEKIEKDNKESYPHIWYDYFSGGSKLSYKERDTLLSAVAELYENEANQASDPALKALYYCKAKEIVKKISPDIFAAIDIREKKMDELRELEIKACVEAADTSSDPTNKALWLLRAARIEKSDLGSDAFNYNLSATAEDNQRLERASILWEKAGDAFSQLEADQFKKIRHSLYLDIESNISSLHYTAAICYDYAGRASGLSFLQGSKGKAFWNEKGERALKLYDKSIKSKQRIDNLELSLWKNGKLTETIADTYQRMLFIVKYKGDDRLQKYLKCMVLAKRLEAYNLFSMIDEQHMRGHVLLRSAVNLSEVAFHSPLKQQVKLYKKAAEIAMKIWKNYPEMLNNAEFNPHYTFSSPEFSYATLAGDLRRRYEHALKKLENEPSKSAK